MLTPRFSAWRARRRAGLAAFLAAVGTLLGACTGSGDGRTGVLYWDVEFALVRRGGLCITAEGAGASCELVIVVRDDGTWLARGTMPPEPAEGIVVAGAASRLASIVEDGWEELTARPFSATCPIAYDGQESIYRVRRIPTGPGAERADAVVREIASCTYDLEHAEARRVLDRLEETWHQLGLSDLGSPGPPGGGEPPGRGPEGDSEG